MTSIPKGITGVILPPALIKEIADKTALFVARSGKAFEQKVLQNEKGNDKFKFLDEGNPFHGYYLSKVDEYKMRLSAGEDVQLEKKEEEQDVTEKPEKSHTKVKARANPFEKLYTVPVERKMPSVELEIIKQMAKYVAQHGKAFLSQIAQKERNNPTFDFLKGSSPRFPVFQNFLKAYTALLNPPKDNIERLQDDCDNRMSILTHCNDVVSWRREDDEQKKVKESEVEVERVAYHSIDWSDFVIVETIDFTDAPTTPTPAPPAGPPPLPVQARPAPVPSLASSAPVAPSGPMPTVKSANQMKHFLDEDEDMSAHVRTGYVRDPQADRKRKADVVDPSGRVIPADAAEEHMRRSTINPQWQKQKQRLQDDLANTVFVSDQESAAALQKMQASKPKDPEDVLEERLAKRKKEGKSASDVRRAAELAQHIIQKEMAKEEEQ
eukprot:TRINITY_DN24571_c0_g1_i1.p1 TRINITY_DN24571_c0_g1~~TRINITY_DN24571_c0_g1_i1.p1  ORF type:complete len:438 (+),score=117.49 TRINITY_DN24571_c0_g1_i1:67-1380(+)